MVDAVRAAAGPYLFVAEAVLLYFEPDQVEQAITLITADFPGHCWRSTPAASGWRTR